MSELMEIQMMARSQAIGGAEGARVVGEGGARREEDDERIREDERVARRLL